MLQNSVLIGGSDDDAGKENALDMPIRFVSAIECDV
jgi:hypothetical protein